MTERTRRGVAGDSIRWAGDGSLLSFARKGRRGCSGGAKRAVRVSSGQPGSGVCYSS